MTEEDCWVENRAWLMNLSALMTDPNSVKSWAYYRALAQEEWNATQRSD